MLRPRLNRRRLQYSLTLLVFMLLANVAMALFFPRWKAARQQRDAVAADRAMGGFVFYDYEISAVRSCASTAAPPGPAWARRLLGDDFFADAVWINDDAYVETMYCGSTPSWPRYPGRITDAWLKPIGKLPRLEVLRIGYSQVTDAGMRDLEGLTNLRELDLSGTRVTDAGLEHLKGLTGLRELGLRNSNVMARG